ncbi:PREDICTED: uncharacterized protein LOC105361190 [Ceratosolen solmsi marchali]|uniref:Uncharacterized protein LOC105361190 n=1 Tax=Ceratosolen solmsi marchali TaxID=326594 RepID=A0AAJ6YEI0_9HYME|nr:PREDICTED: uncharacterized protein LOC105361190 [Ceratosolen solmsi marchali]
MDSRPKIEIVRVPSTERGNFRPLDGVQLRAAYSHVRVGTYCTEPELENEHETPRRIDEVKPPHEQSRKYKKNLGPVSRLLRRRPHTTSLATKSCDNIYSVNKNNGFFEWKHGFSCHDQALHTRQSNSLDWRVGRSIERSSNNLEYQKGSRSAEQLSRNVNQQTPSAKMFPSRKMWRRSKIVSLLRRLSPRLPRPGSKTSMPPSPNNGCHWLQVEYSSPGMNEANEEPRLPQDQEGDWSYQRELQLNEVRKRAIETSKSRRDKVSDRTVISKEKKSPQAHAQLNVQIQQAPQDLNSSRRAVHEERRGSSEERRPGASGEDPGPVATPRTGGRRSRPHSLAVQPLNYQRLDPEQLPEQPVDGRRPPAAKHHPSMTSQESIGSCSLDVERSVSDRSDFANAGSPSEKTLYSLTLSCNGEGTKSSEEERPVDNEHADSDAQEQLTATKKPSYLGLACSISGYSGITRYDSKLREGFRSRDSSPGARLITRETSPAGFRSNETLNVGSQGNPPKSQSISPLAMERHHNGFANGLRDKCKIENYLNSGRGIKTCQGYSEVDRASSGTTMATTRHSSDGFAERQLSPVCAISSNKRNSPVGLRIAAYNQQNKNCSTRISSSSPKSVNFNVSHTSSFDGSLINGSTDPDSCQLNSSSVTASSEKSFIQQRVERLYGPGALAQGFFFKRSGANKLDSSDTSNKSSNNNNTSLDDTTAEESLKSLPVLRHLRPEFRAQLPVVSPRRPTDGTEQIIKPLKRISLTPEINNAKETTISLIKKESKATIDSKMTASVTSLTDQQPAAPKVVLPVLEPSASLTNIPKHGAETPHEVQDKDGHYFMSLLNKERERLISLAVEVESELSRSIPSTLPEEAAGKLRSAAGKARLLASQKMKQFEGLCQKNINQVPGEEFPTTSEDLAGFWDMVMLQVVQVNNLFEQIDRSRKLQWQEDVAEEQSPPATPQNGNATKRRPTQISKVKSSTNSEVARKARESRERHRRQLIEERRRAMRSNANKSENSVEIFVPET